MLAMPARLRAVLSMVGEWNGLADIGTDHAMVPVGLALRYGDSRGPIIATDINDGPLAAAREKVSFEGLGHLIELRKGPGFLPLRECEVDTVTVCGMGHNTIVGMIRDALRDRPGVVWGLHTLVLQANGLDSTLRGTLVGEFGWEIVREDLVYDGGHHYIIDVVEPVRDGRGESDTLRLVGELTDRGIDRELVYAFGPRLIRDRNPHLIGMVDREMKRLGDALGRAALSPAPRAGEARLGMLEELKGLGVLLEWLSESNRS